MKTGIEIPEYAGYRNNEETMKLMESYIYHVWTPSDTAQASIGQLYNLFNRFSSVTTLLHCQWRIPEQATFDCSICIQQRSCEKYEAERKKIEVKKETLKVVQGRHDYHVQAERYWKRVQRFSGWFCSRQNGTPQTGLRHSEEAPTRCISAMLIR